MFNRLKHILGAILGKDYSRLVIDDNSILSHLIGASSKDEKEVREALSETDSYWSISPKWVYDPSTSVFPFFKALWTFIKESIIRIWLFLYHCLECIVGFFKIRKDRPDYRHSVKVNFLLTSLISFFSIIFIILTAVFFLRNVLFYPQRSSTNTYGTITMHQPASTDFSIFLLNSARPWSPTGITVSKGDKVFVTVSGAYYGSMSDIENAARLNINRKYALKDFVHVGNEDVGHHTDMKSINHYCVYGREDLDKDAHIGSLLLQVHPEGSRPSYRNRYHRETFWRRLWHHRDTVDIIQMPFEITRSFLNLLSWKERKPCVFKASKSGTLSVMVNDVYFPKEDKEFRQRIARLDSLSFKNLFGKEFSQGKVFNATGLDSTSLEQMTKILEVNPSVWFDDNVGEALVNVRVERRNHPRGFVFDRFFLNLYRGTVLFFSSWLFGVMMLIMIASLTIDYMIGCKKRKGCKS